MTLRDIGASILDTDLSEYGIYIFWAVMVLLIVGELLRSYAAFQSGSKSEAEN